MRKNTDLYAIVGSWVESLTVEEGHAERTVINYHRYLSRFRDYIGNCEINTITLDEINQYRHWLTTLGLGESTQNYHMIALRQFFKYLGEHGHDTVPYTNIKVPRLARPDVSFLTACEVMQLLEAPDTSTIIGLRDRSILELLFASGLRVSELTSLDRDTIDLDTHEFSVRGKGQKLRAAFITPSASKWLKLYLATRSNEEPALFIEYASELGARLTVRGVQRIVKRYAEQNGLTKQVTPHTLRHSYATNLHKNGADLRDIQELLGHSSIMTTQIYTHITPPQLKSIHERFHTLNNERDMLQ